MKSKNITPDFNHDGQLEYIPDLCTEFQFKQQSGASTHGRPRSPFQTLRKGNRTRSGMGRRHGLMHEYNLRRCVAFMGKDNVSIVRASFQPTYPIVDGDLQQEQKDAVTERLRLLSFCKPDVKLMLNCDHPSVDPWYNGNAEHWAQLMDVTTRYFQEAGYEVVSISPFNEPDYGWGQGTQEDFYNIAGELRKNPRFDHIRISGREHTELRPGTAMVQCPQRPVGRRKHPPVGRQFRQFRPILHHGKGRRQACHGRRDAQRHGGHGGHGIRHANRRLVGAGRICPR